jgi:hypothetical protein
MTELSFKKVTQASPLQYRWLPADELKFFSRLKRIGSGTLALHADFFRVFLR